MSAWFPRLSPDGRRVACGDTEIYVGPGSALIDSLPLSLAIPEAGGARWIDPDELVAGCRESSGVMCWRPNSTMPLRREASGVLVNGLAASRVGWVAYTTVPSPQLVTSDGRVFEGYGSPAIADDGVIVACRHSDGALMRVDLPVPIVLDARPCTAPEFCEGALTWSVFTDKSCDVMGWTEAGGTQPLSLGRWQGNGCPVWTPDGLWLLTYTQTELLLRPYGSTEGYRLAGDADAYYPHAVWDGTQIVVVASTGHGRSRGWRVRLDTPREQLITTLPPSVPDIPPGGDWQAVPGDATINVADFLCGGDWCRDGSPRAGGSAYTHPFQSRRGAGWVQHAKERSAPWRYALWVFGAEGVGLAYDRTNELPAGYRIVNPGTLDTAVLYPAQMRVGQQSRTEVEILNLETWERQRQTFVGTLEAVYLSLVAIGDIPPGLCAVFRFEFDMAGGYVERNYCAAKLGAWAWVETHRRTGASRRWEGVYSASPWEWEQPPQPFCKPPQRPKEPLVTEIKFPPRQEVLQFLNALNDFYRLKLGRSNNHDLYVDNEGLAVWLSEFMRYRTQGVGYLQAEQRVIADIRKVAGL